MKKSTFGFAMLACGGLTLGLAYAEEVKSGLAVGEHPAPYHVKDVTGPSAGKSLCYRCQFGQRPVVNVFTREINDSVKTLIKQLDKELAENKSMKGFVVLLTDDAQAAEKQLKDLAEKEGIKHLPLTVFEGQAGPEEYKISKDADVTVLMWVKSEVKANHAFKKDSFCEECVQRVMADLAKIKT